MGYFRFRRRVRLLPGVTLNVGRTGVSTSLGVRGAHVTVGHGKATGTVGLPGTGISYTTTATPTTSASTPTTSTPAVRPAVWLALLMALAVAAAGVFWLAG